MINDGNGIDIAKHPEYDTWIPEMIFGHLRTSTNYNKDEKRIVGGKNGFGFKLVLIWSTEGSIETVDHTRKLKYTQSFNNNLDDIGKPTIKKCTTKPYTKITFKPDYKRFGIKGLTEDMKNILKRRVYDIAGCTSKSVKLKLNNEVLPVKSFIQYIDLYIGTKSEHNRVHEIANERWEYAVALSPTHEFQQVSFVNGIHTSKGGKHVEPNFATGVFI
jgi:DNA topoisomerase-2